MNLKLPFGLSLVREKALTPPGGAWTVVNDYFTGAFQQGLPALTETQMTRQACVYACITLTSNSIAKMPLNQIELIDGAWQKTPSDYELLRRPSKIANRITWVSFVVASMLTRGAAFGLKRWENGKLRYIELLHPSTEVLVSEAGETFYRLSSNVYSHMPEAQRTIPGDYVFHVVYNPIIHPLIGVPPLEAARAAALSGSAVMNKQALTHQSKPQVYGFLKIPTTLTDAQARAAKDAWTASNNSEGAGIAVLRNGVDFEPLQLTAKEAESSAALTLANEEIARAFGVPKELLSIGVIPSAANAEALMLGFYSKTLQPIAELIELALDEALELRPGVGVEFDVKALSRLDTKGREEAHQTALSSGKISINEARAEDGLPPVKGGELPRVQMQDVQLGKEPEPTPEPTPEPQAEAKDSAEKAINEEDPLIAKQVFELARDVGEQKAIANSLKDRIERLPADVAEAIAGPLQAVKAMAETLSAELQAHRAESAAAMQSLAEKAAQDTRSQLEEVLKGLREELKREPVDLSPLQERLAALETKSRERESAMRFVGTWDEAQTYKTGHAVALKNSLWVAMRDEDLGTPGERNSGWQMCIKSGKVIAPYAER